MTRKDLKQVYYLNKEIKMWEKELAEVESGGLKTIKLTGMPRAGRISDPTAEAAAKIMSINKIIEGLLVQIQIKRAEIFEYIAQLDDSLLRQIITYRCLSLCTWEEVAANIGGGNTAQSVRKIFERHLD